MRPSRTRGTRALRPGQLAAGLLLAVALIFTGCNRRPPVEPTSAVKIFVDEAGLYRLTQTGLAAAGFQLDAASLAGLRLLRRDQDIPFEIEQDGDDISLVFYAQPQPSLYSRADVYWLARGQGEAPAGARMAERALESPRADPPPAVFQATVTLEEDRVYYPNAVGDRHWYWRSLTPPASETIPLTLPAYAGGPAILEIELAGLTEAEHLIQVSVNGRPAGEAAWSGGTTFRFQAASDAWRAGENELLLSAPGGVALAEVDLIDSITVIYPREYRAVEGRLAVEGGAQTLQAVGFGSDAPRLYDVTDPAAVQRLTGGQIQPEGDAFTLSFYDDLPGRRYAAADSGALRQPVEIRPVRAGGIDLRAATNQADYLIVAPAEFFEALQPLIEHRTQDGLRVQLVDIESIYDSFNGGRPDPHALRDFLTYTREHWTAPAPRFVLLAGKATYDYRDNLDAVNKNLVPTFLVSTPHLGEAASDNWFVAVSDEDVHPQTAIGRIPAQTPDELRAVVDKILRYEAALGQPADWRRNAVFVADDKEGSFAASADGLARDLPPGLVAHPVYLGAHAGDVQAARADLVSRWNDGALLMTYIGHGSIDTWAAGPMFSSDYLDQLHNEDRLPILLTPTCLDGYFYHPEQDSLAEALLFKRDGGIVAGLAPTGLSLPIAQEALMQALFAELFTAHPPTLGEAITHAKQQVDATSPEVREVLETFALLGDPALKWEAGE